MSTFNESIGAVWVKVAKTSGEKYLSIQIGDDRYKAFKNKYKTEDKHPDFRIVKDDWKPEAKTNVSQDDELL